MNLLLRPPRLTAIPNQKSHISYLQSEIRNPKSEIRNPQSEIRNQKSPYDFAILHYYVRFWATVQSKR
jgi:hypothetical protein